MSGDLNLINTEYYYFSLNVETHDYFNERDQSQMRPARR